MKEVLEGNRLIAEFMGRKVNGDWIMLGDQYSGRFHVSLLKYHSDWNSIMDVVEKIETMDWIVNTSGHTVIIEHTEDNSMFDSFKNSRIESMWDAVVKFITWYNSQPPK